MSKYMITFTDGFTREFWAENDMGALKYAMDIAGLFEETTFKLDRVGYNQTNIRNVANITNLIG